MTKASSRQQPASIFVSHGSPDLVLHNTEAKRFLEGASSDFPRPHAIVSVSAHFETAIPTIVTDPSPEMIYDFRGFDSRLREIVYSAPGSASIGEKISALLSEAGIDHDTIEKRGFDHGTWVPLSLLYPQADIPVVQLSVQPHLNAAHHYAIGHALRPLVDENVLIIGTGALTHNLSALFSREGLLHNREDEEVEWARQFADWMSEKVDEGDVGSLLDVFARAPFAVQNHPTPEHLLPFFVALGASTKGSGERLHKSTEFAVLAMDAFAFH